MLHGSYTSVLDLFTPNGNRNPAFTVALPRMQPNTSLSESMAVPMDNRSIIQNGQDTALFSQPNDGDDPINMTSPDKPMPNSLPLTNTSPVLNNNICINENINVISQNNIILADINVPGISGEFEG